ncbi:hypothetical protein DSLASN_12040 [Desulfoluna limicola]|uniref:Transposase n=1 Tax=Desulfoluna limicola TaxID=2810562 RepID=A0ABM7PD91_9BACT|nr:hypothetical protein DSLASN_12040 [Desulfoluna limicola]
MKKLRRDGCPARKGMYPLFLNACPGKGEKGMRRVMGEGSWKTFFVLGSWFEESLRPDR